MLLTVVFVFFVCLRRLAGASALRLGERRRPEQIVDPQQRVDPHRERGQELHFPFAVQLHLARRPAVLAPAKALLDPFAHPLAGDVTGMARGGLTSRLGSKRTIAAMHNERNHRDIESRTPRSIAKSLAVATVKQNKYLQMLGVHKSPNLEVTPLPFGWDAGVAAAILHADRWSAGQALMKSTNPTRWATLAAEINLAETNHDALSACRDAAARTKKEQRCTIVVLAP